jgi:AcrR family transcriptional regulator
MATKTAGSEHRIPLTRERVLQTAVDRADHGGLEALTMRQLGQELGVEAMALYHHFSNKDDLVDGMVDLVFSEIDLPGAGEDWRAAMRTRAISVRDALMRHRPGHAGSVPSGRVPASSRDPHRARHEARLRSRR